MAKLYAPLNGAWEVLAFSAMAALLVVQAENGTSTLTAMTALLVVLAIRGSMALPA